MEFNSASGTEDAEVAADDLMIDRSSTRGEIAGERSARPLAERREVVWGLRLAFLVLALAAWQLASGRLVSTFFVSRPSDIGQSLLLLVESGSLLQNILITLEEAAAGYAIGGVLAIIAGVLLGRVRLLGEIFDPFIVAFFSIPKLAIAPLIILWFGIGFESKLVLAGLMTFYMTFWNTYAGVQKVDRDLLNVVRVIGASRSQLMREVIFPASIGWILVGLRMSVPYALMGAVVGEIMAGNHGLGFLVQSSAAQFDTAGVFSVLAILCVLGTIINQAVAYFGRRSQKWNVDG